MNLNEIKKKIKSIGAVSDGSDKLKQAGGVISKIGIKGFLIILIVFIVVMFLMIGKKSSDMKELQENANSTESEHIVNVAAFELKPKVIYDRLDLPGVIEPMVELEVVSEVKGRVIKKNGKEGAPILKYEIIANIDPRDYRNSLNAAEASLSAAQSSFERLKELSKKNLATASDIDEAYASLENLKANQDMAKLNLERCDIKSPVSGILNRITVEEGMYVNIGQPVAQILNINPVKVSLQIPESDIEFIRKVNDFKVRIEAVSSDEFFDAKRYFISKIPDNASHSYTLYLTIENPEHKILPGMFARVNLIRQKVEDALAVPIFAVISKDNSHFVFIEDNGKAVKREVVPGIIDGGVIEIRGVQAGQKVIVMGHRDLSEGTKVNIAKIIENPEDIFK